MGFERPAQALPRKSSGRRRGKGGGRGRREPSRCQVCATCRGFRGPGPAGGEPCARDRPERLSGGTRRRRPLSRAQGGGRAAGGAFPEQDPVLIRVQSRRSLSLSLSPKLASAGVFSLPRLGLRLRVRGRGVPRCRELVVVYFSGCPAHLRGKRSQVEKSRRL